MALVVWFAGSAHADGLGGQVNGTGAAPPQRVENGLGLRVPSSRVEDVWTDLNQTPRSRMTTPSTFSFPSRGQEPRKSVEDFKWSTSVYPNMIDFSGTSSSGSYRVNANPPVSFPAMGIPGSASPSASPRFYPGLPAGYRVYGGGATYGVGSLPGRCTGVPRRVLWPTGSR